MGTKHSTPAADAAGCAFYRITAEGRATAAHKGAPLRSRHQADLLDLLSMAGGGIAEQELRQFMPPDSLGRSIDALLGMGLIEGG